MMAWLTDNLGTIVVSLILAAIVAAIVVSMIRDKKKENRPAAVTAHIAAAAVHAISSKTNGRQIGICRLFQENDDENE